MAQLFTNNATSTLNGAIAANTMQITLNPGDGAKFPSPTNGDFFLFTLFQHLNGYEINWEIASCTGRTGDVLAVGARGLDNTIALPYNNGDFIELRITAAYTGSLATKNSPVLTTPTLAATPAAGDSSLAVPSTQFVQNAVNGLQTVPVISSAQVLTTAQAAAQIIIYTGVLAGNTTVAVPAAAKTFTAINRTTGAFTLTQIAVGGAGIAITQGLSQELTCDGVNILLASSDLSGAGIAASTVWQPISGNTNAIAGVAYNCNTSSAPFNFTFPANPPQNAKIKARDYAGTFATNNLTLVTNGSPFMGNVTQTVTVSTNYLSLEFTFMDSTQGWCLT